MHWYVELRYIADWLNHLDERSRERVVATLRVLEEHGPQLGRPLVDTVSGSRYRNMKELRPGTPGRSVLRILFAFDPRQIAVLLVGGDKYGQWDSWYRRNIPEADRRYAAHLKTRNTNGRTT